MSSPSLIYRTAAGYELVMLALYGRNYRERMRTVAAEVPAGARVLELCCGPGTLYKQHLRAHTSGYIGLDLNHRFVDALCAEGIDARRVDLSTSIDPLPRADVVLMQASLYHFLPDPKPIIDRMLVAAQDRVIVSEPVRNLSSSDHPLIRRLGRRASNLDAGGAGAAGVEGGGAQRFTERTLDSLMQRCSAQVLRSYLIRGGREKVYVLQSA